MSRFPNNNEQLRCTLNAQQFVVDSENTVREMVELAVTNWLGAQRVSLDLLGPYEERDRQIELFAAEGLPLLAELRGPARTPADEPHAE